MPGSRSSNTYTCTCNHFCGGYKTGLSWATFYRHAPYRDAAQPNFSSSFQDFLDKSGRAQFPTEALGGSTQNSGLSTVNLGPVGVA